MSLDGCGTYTRLAAVMHMLAARDLATGKLFYWIRARKRWIEFLAFLKTLRARWPHEQLYVICDNSSQHRHAHVRSWCERNRSSWCSCRPTAPG